MGQLPLGYVHLSHFYVLAQLQSTPISSEIGDVHPSTSFKLPLNPILYADPLLTIPVQILSIPTQQFKTKYGDRSIAFKIKDPRLASPYRIEIGHRHMFL